MKIIGTLTKGTSLALGEIHVILCEDVLVEMLEIRKESLGFVNLAFGEHFITVRDRKSVV